MLVKKHIHVCIDTYTDVLMDVGILLNPRNIVCVPTPSFFVCVFSPFAIATFPVYQEL